MKRRKFIKSLSLLSLAPSTLLGSSTRLNPGEHTFTFENISIEKGELTEFRLKLWYNYNYETHKTTPDAFLDIIDVVKAKRRWGIAKGIFNINGYKYNCQDCNYEYILPKYPIPMSDIMSNEEVSKMNTFWRQNPPKIELKLTIV